MTFQELIRRCSATAYSEPDENDGHKRLSELAVHFMDQKLAHGSRVLDIGIGNGFALDQFKARGHNPLGLGVRADEIEAAREKGHEVLQLDMHDINQITEKFDAVFARHVLEHSPCPLLVLHNIASIIKPLGYLYVEVPTPFTVCEHEANSNHYSVLPFGGWAHLIKLAGFSLMEGGHLPILTPKGIDCYFGITAQKR